MAESSAAELMLLGLILIYLILRLEEGDVRPQENLPTALSMARV